MPEELVTIAVFASPFEAGMAKSELEAYGIPAFIADEFTVGANPLYSNALGGIKLKVTASRAQEAHELLSAKTASKVEVEACESTRGCHRVMTKTSVWMYLLIGAAMTVVVFYICRKWFI